MELSVCFPPRSLRVWGVALALAVGGFSPQAWAATDAALRMEIVVIRHGVRAPTASPQELAHFASRPWPDWPVAPGELTEHGAQVMRDLGRWYRTAFDAAGLLQKGCAGAQAIALIADSTPRNRASAQAMLGGLAPDCADAAYAAFPAGRRDPLFSGLQDETGGKGAKPAGSPPSVDAELAELEQVLLGCHDEACLAKARAQGKTVLIGGESPAKALKDAGSLAENLMLHYAQGMPLADVGWGTLDAAGVERLIELHNASFAYANQGAAGRARGSNLLAHIAATLTAAAGQAPQTGVLAPASSRIVILIGHDTNLANLAGLLGLDWHTPGQRDAYPPGGALVFDLFGNGKGGDDGRYSVRVRTVMPTLDALRRADVRTPGAVVTVDQALPACGGKVDCPLADFRALVAHAIDPAAVAAQAGDEPPVR